MINPFIRFVSTQIVLIFAIVWNLPIATAQSAEENSSKNSPRIVSEKFAEIEDWPFVAAIRGRHPVSGELTTYCGGTYIAENWVVTAAHCVIHSDQDLVGSWSHIPPQEKTNGGWTHSVFGEIEVVGGSADLSREDSLTVASVKSIRVHPNYVPLTEKNDALYDLALIELDARWNGPVAPISLDSTASLENGALGHVVGFGSTGESNSLQQFTMSESGETALAGSRFLKYATLPIVSADRCSSVYQQHDPEIHLCAGFDAGGVDACQGDSGGPFVIRNSEDSLDLIGVVSFGRGCARSIHEYGGYGVYARLANEIDWIRSVVGDLDLSSSRVKSSANAIKVVLNELLASLTQSRTLGSAAILEVNLNNDIKFRQGDKLEFELQSPISGKLLILHVDAEGKLNQLFPNGLTKVQSDDIEANTVYRWPSAKFGQFDVVAGPPFGREQLVMLVVPEGFPISEELGLRPPEVNALTRGFEIRESVFTVASIAEEVIQPEHGMGPSNESGIAFKIVDMISSR